MEFCIKLNPERREKLAASGLRGVEANSQKLLGI